MTELNTHVEEAHLLLEQAKSIYKTDRQRARALAEQSLAACRRLNDPWYLAQALDLAGRAYQTSGSLLKAKELMEEGFRVRQALDDKKGSGQSLRILGNLARWMGNFEEAEALIRQSMALFTELKDTQQLALTTHTLHGILVYGGQFVESIRLFEEPALIYRELGLPEKPNEPSIVSAFAFMHLGRYKEAEERFQRTLSIYPKTASGYAVKNLGRIALVRGNYDEAQTHLLEALTLFRNTGDPNGLGQTLGCLGITALRLGNLTQAQDTIHENRQIAAETLIILPSMTALSSTDLLNAKEGHLESAIELYTVALQSGHVANSRWYHDVIGQYIDSIAESLPSAVIEAAKERGRERFGKPRYRNSKLLGRSQDSLR